MSIYRMQIAKLKSNNVYVINREQNSDHNWSINAHNIPL